MKLLKLTILAVLSTCFGMPVGYRTANAKAAADPAAETESTPPAVDPAIQKQLDDQAEEIAELKRQAAAFKSAPAAPSPSENSSLALLCRGAGVDPADVRWRVAAGLDEKQAVDAAVAQKKSDATRKEGK